MQNKKITVTGDDGKAKDYDILFTHHSDEFNKDYVVFEDPENNVASAFEYIEVENGQGKLEEIKTDKEWDMLEELLNDYYDSLEDEDEEDECANCPHASNCQKECEEDD